MLIFGWCFEVAAWSRLWRLNLIKISWELVIWPKEVTLVSRTQPSGPLCLWQCLYNISGMDGTVFLRSVAGARAPIYRAGKIRTKIAQILQQVSEKKISWKWWFFKNMYFFPGFCLSFPHKWPVVSSISTGCGRAEQGLGFTGLGSGHLGRARRPDFPRGQGVHPWYIFTCVFLLNLIVWYWFEELNYWPDSNLKCSFRDAGASCICIHMYLFLCLLMYLYLPVGGVAECWQ